MGSLWAAAPHSCGPRLLPSDARSAMTDEPAANVAQIEGSIFWGASLAMLEKGSMKDGGIEQRNFDSYTPMRMSQIPEIDVSIIGNGEPGVGCGEPAVTVIAPAIGNAVFNAVGARVRSLPITAEAVKAAMKT